MTWIATALLSGAAMGVACTLQAANDLEITMVGNAGVVLADGTTTLLIDLPYQPGAYGYMQYEPARLNPRGQVVSVITHGHLDHFDPTLFAARDWLAIAPADVAAELPPSRILEGDSIQVGDFAVVALTTPHSDVGHQSYRIRWHARVFYFVGDTEAAGTVPTTPTPDVLFITPWLSCNLAGAGSDAWGDRNVIYHAAPSGNDRVCGPVEQLPQGASWTVAR